VPAERVAALVTTGGVDAIGENRVQEAAAKIPLVPGIPWHLVGHLQANKAGPALELFTVIQSVDSLALAQRLDRLLADSGGEAGEGSGSLALFPVLLQVNVDADPGKAGFAPDGIGRDLDALASLPHLELQGLMTVGRLVGDPEAARPTFVALRGLSEALRARSSRLGAELSMGMSDDCEVAIEEGATVVRVGRAIFGERPPG